MTTNELIDCLSDYPNVKVVTPQAGWYADVTMVNTIKLNDELLIIIS